MIRNTFTFNTLLEQKFSTQFLKCPLFAPLSDEPRVDPRSYLLLLFDPEPESAKAALVKSLFTSLYIHLFTILQLVWQLLLTSTDSTDYSCEFL